VNHLVGLLQPALDDLWARYASPLVVDAASGNAYLGFILYELFFKPSDKGRLLSIESREDLAQRAKERAQRLDFARMEFQTAELTRAELPGRVHLLTALHACDTATDDALSLAVRHNADYVALIPCCQAELAEQLKRSRIQSPPLRALFEHPLHRREFASHLTNVIRALALESFGYQVTVTEFTGWEHSSKNELILGRRIHRENANARAKLTQLLTEVDVAPRLVGSLNIA
jgi:hypothetical protein